MGSSEDQYDVLRFDGYYYRRILSCAPLCPTLSNSITVACQAPLSMRFFRQEYWSGLPFPPPEDLPDPRMEPVSFGSPWIGRQILYHCNQGNHLLWEKDFLYSQKLPKVDSLYFWKIRYANMKPGITLAIFLPTKKYILGSKWRMNLAPWWYY